MMMIENKSGMWKFKRNDTNLLFIIFYDWIESMGFPCSLISTPIRMLSLSIYLICFQFLPTRVYELFLFFFIYKLNIKIWNYLHLTANGRRWFKSTACLGKYWTLPKAWIFCATWAESLCRVWMWKMQNVHRIRFRYCMRNDNVKMYNKIDRLMLLLAQPRCIAAGCSPEIRSIQKEMDREEKENE